MAESNESETQAAAGVQKSEDDIDSLLDSALDDFSKVSLDAPKPPTSTKTETPLTDGDEETERMWAEMLKEALQSDSSLSEMLGDGVEKDNFMQGFTKIAEAAAKAAAGAVEGDSGNSLADVMSETLRSLNENSEFLSNQFGDPEQMAGLFQEMGISGDAFRQGGNFDDIPPFLQNIMRQFLSKDVLYPSIKEFVSRYPQWLESHKESLSQEQYDNYAKQLELMKKVVEEFEAEAEEDSEEVKTQRFQRILNLLQQMQALGQPPAELIQADGLLDESSLANMPPGLDPQQCCLM